MYDAGLVVIVALVSPFRADRDLARSLFPAGDFLEVYVDTSVDVCAERDPKGLYAKAAAGTPRDDDRSRSALRSRRAAPELVVHGVGDVDAHAAVVVEAALGDGRTRRDDARGAPHRVRPAARRSAQDRHHLAAVRRARAAGRRSPRRASPTPAPRRTTPARRWRSSNARSAGPSTVASTSSARTGTDLVDEVAGRSGHRAGQQRVLRRARPPTRSSCAIDGLGRDRTHVVVTLRPLTKILPSSWQQYLKGGSTRRFETWLEGVLADPPDPTITPTFWQRQDHAALVQRWADDVGVDNLTVDRARRRRTTRRCPTPSSSCSACRPTCSPHRSTARAATGR